MRRAHRAGAELTERSIFAATANLYLFRYKWPHAIERQWETNDALVSICTADDWCPPVLCYRNNNKRYNFFQVINF